MVKQNLPSFGRARKKYVYLLHNSKKKATLEQDFSHITKCNIKTMPRAWHIQCSRINVKQLSLHSLVFTFHIRVIVIALTSDIINIKTKGLHGINLHCLPSRCIGKSLKVCVCVSLLHSSTGCHPYVGNT
jgi:hypothetical protein